MPAFLLVLLEAAAKGAVILTLVLVAMPLMRRASAAARHLVLALAMLAATAVLPLAALLPAWRVPLLAPIGATALPPVAVPAPAAPMPARTVSTPPASASPRPVSTERALVAAPLAARSLVPSTPALFVALWLLGVAAVLAHHAVGALLVARLRGRALPLADARLAGIRDELARRLGIARPVELLASPATDMPLTWGTRRPAVLLPHAACRWSDAQSRVVLHHELAHVARHDCAWQLVATAATALHWYNPAAWLAARRLRAERERACDDLVLQGGTDPCDYAERLLHAARAYRAPRGLSAAAIAMARPSQLRGRVAAILDHATTRTVPSPRGRRLAAAAMVALVLPTSAMRPWRALETRVAGGETTSVPTMRAPFDAEAVLGALPSRTDTLRWVRRMQRGQELRVYTMKSAIQVEPSPDADVHLITIFGADDGRGPRQHEFDEDERSIEVCPALPATVKRIPVTGCWPVDWDRERRLDNTVRTIAQVPDGIHLRLRTHDGAIVASGITAPLVAETVDGDVHVRAAGPVSANAVGGNIDVALARTAWLDHQYLKTVSGRITLRLPRDANIAVAMKHLAGKVRTNLAVASARLGAQGRTHTLARAGAGTSRIDVESWTGEITLVREGGAALETPGGTVSTDDEETRPDPASAFAYRVSEGGATDERVALDLPADFLREHSPVIWTGGLDSARRTALLRVAAPRWAAYQRGVRDPGVELAGDRALWALSVSDDVDLDGAMLEKMNDPSWRVRAYAAWILGAVRAPRATEALVHALGDAHWRVRAAAASALAATRPPSAVPHLQDLLSDPQYQVRAAALNTLGAIGDRRALPSIRARLNDEHAMVRAEAESAVARLDARER